MQRTASVAALALMASAPLATGCRSHAGLKQQYDEMRSNMSQGHWDVAAAQLESSKDKIYKEQDRVMFWLNLGTLLHYAGDYNRSGENFVRAEEAIQDLWTTSISGEASKVVVSETLADYGGEDFEKVLVYLYTALNQVKLGKPRDALVEARRADELLKKMLVHYERDGGEGTIYRQDAFVLWLIGLFYEMEGTYSDAHILYKQAHEAYEKEYKGKFGTPTPTYLAEDVVRTAKLAGFPGDVERLKQELRAPGTSIAQMESGMGEVIFLHANGEAPYKVEKIIQGPMPDGYVMRIAIPAFQAVPTRIDHAQVRIGGDERRTEVAEPITAIALKNFEYRLPAISTRAIARAAIKYVATKAAEAAVSGGDDASGERKLAGALVGLFGNVASAASEAADLRAWTTLPARFGVTRMWVAPGSHTVEVAYMGSGRVMRTERIPVEVVAGKRHIVSVRTLE